jgi:acetoin utilization deacetylase AcuC-like enzyme
VIIITDERCTEYRAPGHPERPERISRTLAKLRSQNEVEIRWEKPANVDSRQLLRAHTADHVQRLGDPGSDFDGDTPAHPSILDHALRGAGGGLRALSLARAGETVFSLLRPPGHHAKRSKAMGFCYLNSIAITVLEALETGARKVAVLDFDVHHGNGTEAILVGNQGAVFASVHQYPCYPGTGTADVGDNCFNYPVPPEFPRLEYRKTLTQALERLLAHKPDLLGVSAGFDAYARDPIAHETLEADDFHWLGERIRQAGLPVFSLLEGGYSSDLPELIFAYLKGLSGK